MRAINDAGTCDPTRTLACSVLHTRAVRAFARCRCPPILSDNRQAIVHGLPYYRRYEFAIGSLVVTTGSRPRPAQRRASCQLARHLHSLPSSACLPAPCWTILRSRTTRQVDAVFARNRRLSASKSSSDSDLRLVDTVLRFLSTCAGQSLAISRLRRRARLTPEAKSGVAVNHVVILPN